MFTLDQLGQIAEYLGPTLGVVIVVFIFINYLTDQAKLTRIESAKRDKEWRDFFTLINQATAGDMSRLAASMVSLSDNVQSLCEKMEDHDKHVDRRIREITQQVKTKGVYGGL